MGILGPALLGGLIMGVGMWPRKSIFARSLELLLVASCLTMGLPCSIALFNDRLVLPSGALESKF